MEGKEEGIVEEGAGKGEWERKWKGKRERG